jgi:hypothetical protein
MARRALHAVLQFDAAMQCIHAGRQAAREAEAHGNNFDLARGSSLFTHYKYSRSGKRPQTETTDTVRCPIKNCTGLHLEILVYDLN